MLLAPDFPSRDRVGIMWAALRECYATEAEAIEAARRYPSLVLPYMNTPGNIVGCYDVLVELLGVSGAREVAVKNPAVLGNNPASLRRCTAKDVRATAELREFLDTKLPFGLRAWTRAFVLLVAVGIALAVAPAFAASDAAVGGDAAAAQPSPAAGLTNGVVSYTRLWPSGAGAALVAGTLTHWLLYEYSTRAVALTFDFACMACVLYWSSSAAG